MQRLDELLQYIIEGGGLRPRSSIVMRNSEVVLHIVSVVFDDVSRTPKVNEDGCRAAKRNHQAMRPRRRQARQSRRHDHNTNAVKS